MSLVKVLVGLAVIGLLLFDAGAVMVNHVQADDFGQRALRAAVAASANGTGGSEAVEAAARRVEHEASRASVDTVYATTQMVSITVSQRARVLLIDRIGPLEDLATATVTKEAIPKG